jgi:hypothetical protein
MILNVSLEMMLHGKNLTLLAILVLLPPLSFPSKEKLKRNWKAWSSWT